MALDMIRRLQVGLSRADVARVDLEVTPEVANYLNNVMRARLQELENETRKQIVVHANPDMGQDEHKIAFLKEGGAVVTV
jgi:Ribonuclease G/E